MHSPWLLGNTILLGIALGSGPNVVHAAPPADETKNESVGASETAPADPRVEQARELYERGQTQYETLDYLGAVELWTEAYGVLSDDPSHRSIRNTLVYNIATAREQAFDVDRKITHLRQARGLLLRYKDDYVKLYESSPTVSAQLQEVDLRIANLDAKIKAAEADPTTVKDSGDELGDGLSTTPPPPQISPERALKLRVRELLTQDAQFRPRYGKAKGLVVGGGVATGIGGGLMLFGLPASVISYRDDLPGRIGYAVVASLGIASLATGITLLVIGSKKKRVVVQEARAQAQGELGIP